MVGFAGGNLVTMGVSVDDEGESYWSSTIILLEAIDKAVSSLDVLIILDSRARCFRNGSSLLFILGVKS